MPAFVRIVPLRNAEFAQLNEYRIRSEGSEGVKEVGDDIFPGEGETCSCSATWQAVSARPTRVHAVCGRSGRLSQLECWKASSSIKHLRDYASRYLLPCARCVESCMAIPVRQ